MPRNLGSSIILTLWPGVALTAGPPEPAASSACRRTGRCRRRGGRARLGGRAGRGRCRRRGGRDRRCRCAGGDRRRSRWRAPLDEHPVTNTIAASRVNDVLYLDRIPIPPPKPGQDGREAARSGAKAARSYRKKGCLATRRLRLDPATEPVTAVRRKRAAPDHHEVRHEHRQDQQQPDHAGLGVARHVGEPEAVAQVKDQAGSTGSRPPSTPCRRRC